MRTKVLCATFVALSSLYCLVSLALLKSYGVDEFTHAHAAWLISQGFLPYKDIFLLLPFPIQIFSLPFNFLESQPENIRYLRLVSLLLYSISITSAAFINRNLGFSWILITISLYSYFLFLPAFALEIRPDTVASTLFLLTLALASSSTKSQELRGGLIGIVLALSILSSPKAVIYALPLVLIALLNILRNNDSFLGNLKLLGFTFVLVLLGFFAYLQLNGILSSWYEVCVLWTLEHQGRYPGFSWISFFFPIVSKHWYLAILGGFGLVYSSKEYRNSSTHKLNSFEFLLAFCLIASLLSVSLQQAAFPYSQIPFWSIFLIYVARGIRLVVGQVSKSHKGTIANVLLLLIVVVSLVGVNRYLEKNNNSRQHKVLTKLEKLTNKNEPVYDNSGGAVTRPHVSYFFFTDSFIRQTHREKLAKKLPNEILEAKPVAFLYDFRFKELPENVMTFVRTNFQKYSADIWLPGRKFPAGNSQVQFELVSPGEYFIVPESKREIIIDGEKMSGEKVFLQSGNHSIVYNSISNFYLLMLPKNKQVWQPTEDIKPSFLPKFNLHIP